MGILSIVATPIGNLEDITLRALRILREADLIACEDTRTTKKLLGTYGIDTPTISFHAHSGDAKFERMLSLIKEGKHIALVTDAGMPGVSDPGGELVARIRQLTDARIEIIPGPSALTAALAVAGIPTDKFVYMGFLPHKKGRETAFRTIAAEARAMVFFESSHRIKKTLQSLQSLIPAREVRVCRELTKMYEEVLSGTPGDILAAIVAEPAKEKGECVVVIAPDGFASD